MIWIDLAVNKIKKAVFVNALTGGKLQPHLVDGMRRVAVDLEAKARKRVSGSDIKVRTGSLRRALFSRAAASGSADAVAIVGVDGSKAAYGRIHEMGGTLRAKSGRMAIPVGQARTASGVTRFSAREFIQSPGAFGFTGSFTRKNVIFGRRGKSITPLFALRNEVKIKPVGFLRATVNDRKPWAAAEMGRVVAAALKKMFANG